MSDSYLFIPKHKWEEFANKITDGQFICKDGVAMYSELKVQGTNDSHAICLLTIYLCDMVYGNDVWKEFVTINMNSELDKEHHDIPPNDWREITLL